MIAAIHVLQSKNSSIGSPKADRLSEETGDERTDDPDDRR